MGLGDRLRQLPRAIINTIDLYQGGRRRARIATESLGFIGCFIPQPAVLAMLTEESRKHPSFQLHLGTAVRDLIRRNPVSVEEIRCQFIILARERNPVSVHHSCPKR